MAGDAETGVSIMRVTAGPRQRPGLPAPRPSRSAPTTPTARSRRASSSSAPTCSSGRSTSGPPCREQDEDGVTYAEKISAADRTLDPRRPAEEHERVVRALHPHIGARLPAAGRQLPRRPRRARRRRRREPRAARGPAARRPPDGLRRLRPRPRAAVTEDLDLAVRAVRAGAAAALAARGRARRRRRPATSRSSSRPTDFVSRADTASEAAIVATPPRRAPGRRHPRRRGRERRRREPPPLGRRRHRRHLQLPVGIPHWCVAVGLEDGGEPIDRRRLRPDRRRALPRRPRPPDHVNGTPATVRTGRSSKQAAVATYLARTSRDREPGLARLVDHTASSARAGRARSSSRGSRPAASTRGRSRTSAAWDWVPGAALVRHAGGVADRPRRRPGVVPRRPARARGGSSRRSCRANR